MCTCLASHLHKVVVCLASHLHKVVVCLASHLHKVVVCLAYMFYVYSVSTRGGVSLVALPTTPLPQEWLRGHGRWSHGLH